MKVLAIETSSLSGSVALMDHKGLLGALRLESGARHSEQLMGAIDRLMKESNTVLSDLDAIAVSIGPGSFTGLRIGLATAKGLAMGGDKPMVLVPSMEVIAAAFPLSQGLIVPFLDARREEVYWSLFDYRQADLVRCKPDQVTSVREALENLEAVLRDAIRPPPKELLFVGDGGVKYQKCITDTFGTLVRFPSQNDLIPSAEQLAERGLLRLEKGDLVPHEQALPLYLRPSRAELKWRAGQGKIGSS